MIAELAAATPLAADPSVARAARGLLLLAYWYPPENESGALRPARFSKFLTRFGYQPRVISAPFDGAALPDVHRTTREAQDGPRVSARFGRAVQRFAPYNDRLEWVMPARALARRVIRNGGIDVLLSTSPPVACHISAWLIAREHGLPWVADFRDPIVGNPFRTRALGRYYDSFVERLVVERASAILVNTDTAYEEFAGRHPRQRHKFHLLWNGYDPDDNLRALPLPPRDHKVLAHLGSVYGARHPGVVLGSLTRLASAGRLDLARIRLRLVGSIDREQPWLATPEFTAISAQGCIETTDGFVPREAARREMGEADYLLLLDLNETGTAIQVPAKLFEYVRVGRPILALTTHGSPVARILAQSGVPHVCVYPDDANAAVDDKLATFFSLPSDAVAPAAWFREQFDVLAQTSTLAGILDSVVAERKS